MEAVSASSYLDTLTPEEYERANNSLARTQRGFAKDLVSPLVPNRNHPVEGREIRRNEATRAMFPTGYDWLDELESAQREKIGPYSIMLPYDARRENVYSYFSKRNLSVNSNAWNYATSQLVKEVNRELSPVDVETAFDEMPRGTNLGLPWLSRDKEYLPEVLAKVRNTVRSGFPIPNFQDPAMLYWRGQPRGMMEVPKQRTVWGFPHDITVLELMIQIPLLNYLKSRRGYSAWVGIPAVNREVTTVIDHATLPIMSVDFSGFDASIPGVLINQVFEILKVWFRPRNNPLIDFVKHTFMTIGLLTPEGILIGRDGGVPSGSGLTNLIDSLVQKFAFHYTAFRMRNEIHYHVAQGDDGIVLFGKPWDLETVTDIMQSELGLTVSADKGGVSTDRVYFLQNVHSANYRVDGVCVGIRPFFKVLNGALSFETLRSRDWTPYMNSLRWLQQWEAARFHPMFPQCVNLLLEWDRYLQNNTIAEIVHGAGGIGKAKSLLNEKAFPYGKFSLSGLAAFRTVEILEQYKTERYL